MRNISIYKAIVLMAMMCLSQAGYGQGIVGKWLTIDGQTGEQKSIVEIYEQAGEYFGRIVEILNPADRDALCTKCRGEELNTPVLGLVLIKNMKPSGKYYKSGTIFHPEHGKKFRCRLMLTEDPDVLQVRGYVSFLYATEYWKRVR